MHSSEQSTTGSCGFRGPKLNMQSTMDGIWLIHNSTLRMILVFCIVVFGYLWVGLGCHVPIKGYLPCCHSLGSIWLLQCAQCREKMGTVLHQAKIAHVLPHTATWMLLNMRENKWYGSCCYRLFWTSTIQGFRCKLLWSNQGQKRLWTRPVRCLVLCAVVSNALWGFWASCG